VVRREEEKEAAPEMGGVREKLHIFWIYFNIFVVRRTHFPHLWNQFQPSTSLPFLSLP